MKIAVIGAGFTGLAAGYRLSQNGHDVTIFEQDEKPGGLAIGYKEKDWDWSLEKFYHHWFTNDDSILNLAKEINFSALTKRPKTSSFIDNEIYQLDSPSTLLTFDKLNIFERMQMGFILGLLKINPFWEPLEKITATSFLSKTIGKKAYAKLWQPLLVGKFGNYANKISLAWFWARIKKRTTFLSYPEGGFLNFAEKIADKIETLGGKIYYKTSIEKIEEEDGKIILGKSFETYDKVIVTLPSFIFARLSPQLPENYKNNLSNLTGLGAVMLILRLKEKFLKDDTYWLSVCDTKAPVLAVVEHTNFMDKSHYNNEHLVYLGNYLPQNHKYFSMDKKELFNEFEGFLKKLNPDFKKDLIDFEKFAVPFAQPIIPVNYSKSIPPFVTPIKNVYLANMQQVYPWDRGTNYAVELGERVTKLIDEK